MLRASIDLSIAVCSCPTKILPNGVKYIGDWQGGVRHGEGTCLYKDGSVYKGGWKYDKWHGQGTMVFVDNDRYKGEYRYGIIHGQGTSWIVG